MWDIIFYLFVIVLLAGLALAGALIVRAIMTGTSPAAALFGTRPERRLDVVEHTSVDGKRRLVLVRRDDVEHLIMTGGPVDVVIETGIRDGYVRAPAAQTGTSPPLFTRAARVFGQAAAGE